MIMEKNRKSACMWYIPIAQCKLKEFPEIAKTLGCTSVASISNPCDNYKCSVQAHCNCSKMCGNASCDDKISR